MASQLQLRRGTTAQHGPFIGAPGEVTVDTDKKTTVVHDGSTAGGFPVLSASGGTMTGPVSMGGSKITSLATPTALTDAASKGYVDGLIAAATIADDDYGDVTVSSGATVWTVNNGVIADANIASGAAVALNKLATGALPTGITVASANLVNGTIVDADINAAANIAGSKLANDTITDAKIKSDAAIALSKLATGALPTAITVASANLVNGTIVDADISATAAIAGSKLANAGITAAKLDGAQTGSAPIYGCRAWVNFNGSADTTGAASTANTNRFIRASGNVTSVLRNGAGDYTVTFTIPMPDANYAAIVSGDMNFTGMFNAGAFGAISAASLRVGTQFSTGAAGDRGQVFVSIFR